MALQADLPSHLNYMSLSRCKDVSYRERTTAWRDSDDRQRGIGDDAIERRAKPDETASGRNGAGKRVGVAALCRGMPAQRLRAGSPRAG